MVLRLKHFWINAATNKKQWQLSNLQMVKYSEVIQIWILKYMPHKMEIKIAFYLLYSKTKLLNASVSIIKEKLKMEVNFNH